MIKFFKDLMSSLTPNASQAAFLESDKIAEDNLPSDEELTLRRVIADLGGISIKTLTRPEGDATGCYASFMLHGRNRSYGVRSRQGEQWLALADLIHSDFAALK
ncbi:hypothetical protein [Sphingorhabdus sp. SMR4y]|uniref:hypothetical protein n=1 Tax=Sphingorhabdus sp. SMR4y TaxID=2584094 RepID=UPI000B5C1FAF|nr:hypothetical protein [Sphingorhabdus sp. SMR4y]ASK88468.1 hypothetical protein SPHFLASMR4Y_01721 [Sphingorhabdus sp. SMR4y]